MAQGKRITPMITSRGMFEVEAPFELDKKKIYEVVAIREFDDLYSEHIDIFETYYEPVGLAEDIYKRDAKLGAAIISIRGEDGIHYIPDTFIISYPELGMANYYHAVMSVSLGPINRDVNLKGLQAEIASICSKFLGVKATVKLHSAPLQYVLSNTEAKKLEQVRRGMIDVPDTAELRYQNEKRKNDAIVAANNRELLRRFGAA